MAKLRLLTTSKTSTHRLAAGTFQQTMSWPSTIRRECRAWGRWKGTRTRFHKLSGISSSLCWSQILSFHGYSQAQPTQLTCFAMRLSDSLHHNPQKNQWRSRQFQASVAGNCSQLYTTDRHPRNMILTKPHFAAPPYDIPKGCGSKHWTWTKISSLWMARYPEGVRWSSLHLLEFTFCPTIIITVCDFDITIILNYPIMTQPNTPNQRPCPIAR